MKWGAKKVVARSAAASLIALAVLGAATAGNTQERALFISPGDVARVPIGWVEFCVAYEPECRTKPTTPRDVYAGIQ